MVVDRLLDFSVLLTEKLPKLKKTKYTTDVLRESDIGNPNSHHLAQLDAWPSHCILNQPLTYWLIMGRISRFFSERALISKEN